MRKYQWTLNPASEEENLINLTPLIDVVFVVLILFILVAPLLESERVALAGAGTQGEKVFKTAEEATPIKIYVFDDNTIWVNNTLIPHQELFSYLQKYSRQMPDVIPQIFHDEKAFFGTYQTVKNALEAAGFQEMDIILKPGQ
jgi:biopolymer transport protein ExbD